MAWNEWAYDTNVATLPAETTTRDTDVLNTLTGSSRSPGAYINGTSPSLNAIDVYPVTRTGAPPDQWYERDAVNDTFAYIADPDDASGQLYQVTEAFRELSYADARKLARTILESYYRAYAQSYFTASGVWFSAAIENQSVYTKTDIFVRRDVANSAAISYVIFDIDDNAHRFTLEAEWNGFLNKWQNLDKEARDKSDAAWTAVKEATTTDQVRTIINGLDPIPAPP